MKEEQLAILPPRPPPLFCEAVSDGFVRHATSEKTSLLSASVVSFCYDSKWKKLKTKTNKTEKPTSKPSGFLEGTVIISFIRKAIYKETPHSCMTTFRGPVFKRKKNGASG